MLNVTTEGYATAGGDTVEVIFAAPAKPSRWSIGGIVAGYDTGAAIAGGELIVYDGSDSAGNIVCSITLNDDQRFISIIPAEPVKFRPGRSVHIKLLNSGASVGKISVLGYKLV